jgi:hypothetical protein
LPVWSWIFKLSGHKNKTLEQTGCFTRHKDTAHRHSKLTATCWEKKIISSH